MTSPSAPAAASSETLGFLDGPSRSATLERWERHLAFLKSLPNNALLKQQLIATAEERIAEKRLRGDK